MKYWGFKEIQLFPDYRTIPAISALILSGCILSFTNKSGCAFIALFFVVDLIFKIELALTQFTFKNQCVDSVDVIFI